MTKISPDLNSNFNFYIQSTDKNGEVASMYIYQSSRTDISVGNVLTLVGAAELYNNLPEFINPLIEVDSLTNDSPVQTLVTDATFWENGSHPSSDQFLAAQLMGPRQVRINNVYLSHINTGNATILINGSVQVPVYYANLSATSSIASRINAISDSTIDIIGYVNAYKSGTTTKLQLLLRDVKDLIGGVEFEYSLQMNSSTSYRVGSYSTGNYGQGTVGGFYTKSRCARPGNFDTSVNTTLSKGKTCHTSDWLSVSNVSSSLNCLPVICGVIELIIFKSNLITEFGRGKAISRIGSGRRKCPNPNLVFIGFKHNRGWNVLTSNIAKNIFVA